MLSSNSEPNPQQPRFRLLRICFARKSDCKTKNPLPEADFLCRNVGESADYANFAEVQAAKPSSRWERQIAGCETVLPSGAANCRLRNRRETVLPSGAANCRLRNRPPAGSGKLQAAKTSSCWERQIAAINRRGVLHTPEYIRNDKWAHSGRMRYAPTSIFTQ